MNTTRPEIGLGSDRTEVTHPHLPPHSGGRHALHTVYPFAARILQAHRDLACSLAARYR